ncbi:MAG: hypothetical protein AAGJ50_13730 [Pseudomonadota bacterium]
MTNKSIGLGLASLALLNATASAHHEHSTSIVASSAVPIALGVMSVIAGAIAYRLIKRRSDTC